MKKLPSPYPVNKVKNQGYHVLYLSRRFSDDPDGNQVAVFMYGARYAAKRALELLLEQDDLLWIHDNKLQSETGIIIEIRPCKDTRYTLRQLWEYELTIAEMAWEMKPPHSTECKTFRYRRQATTLEPQQERRRGKGAPRSSRQGMTPIGDIALALGITAREARAAFRKAKIPKPPQGWAFPPGEVEAVKAKLQEVL